jgi:hypothetical protein
MVELPTQDRSGRRSIVVNNGIRNAAMSASKQSRPTPDAPNMKSLVSEDRGIDQIQET